MVKMNLTYIDHLKLNAEHESSGTKISTAAPKDNQGDGSSFSPTDLLATSLASCMATIMGIKAKPLQIDLTGMKVEVIKEMTASLPRKVKKLTLTFDIPGNIKPDYQKQLIEAARNCPVALSIHPDIEVVDQFNWH